MNQQRTVVPSLIVWLTFTAFFFYQFFSRSVFPSALNDYFIKHFGLSAADFGSITSCYYMVYTIMQIPAGILLDKFDIKKVSAVAISSCALGTLLFSSSNIPAVAAVGQMFSGFGSAFAFLMIIKVSTILYPQTKSAIMLSYSVSIGCLCPVLGGQLVHWLSTKCDWKIILQVYSAIGFMLAALAYVLTAKMPSPQSSNQDKVSLIPQLSMLVKSWQLWLAAIFQMTVYSPLSALSDCWGVPFLQRMYPTSNKETLTLASSMIYAGFVVGTPTWPYIAKALKSYKKAMILSAACAALFCAPVLYFNIPVTITVCLLFLTGLSSACMLGYPMSLLLFPKNMGGTVSGFVNTVCMASGVILMPLIGKIIDYSWDGSISALGEKVYSLSDFRLALSSVILFLIAGVVVAFFLKDQSLSESEKS